MTESDSINLLQLASLDTYMGVDDAIMINGHCMKLDYYSIRAHMGIPRLDFLSP